MDSPVTPAGVGRRTAAALVDLVLMLGLCALFAYAIGTWDVEGSRKRIALEDWDFVLYVGAVLAYFFILETTTGTSLGKALLGLRVADADGGDPGPGQILTRTLVRVVDFLPILYLVGFVAILANERNARLGDLAAKTAVVRRG